MCGIIGYNGYREASDILIEGLKRLEYRGYDSAGVAIQNNGNFIVVKSEGKISKLQQMVGEKKPKGTLGIGHTRWATHGKPSDTNAHPHSSEKAVIVHNGIVENFRALRRELEERGIEFVSETDTEVICHLLSEKFKELKDAQRAVIEALKRVEGAYAIVTIFENSNVLIGARRGAPLVVGLGKGEHFIASDVTALLPFTRDFVFLEDGDLVVVRKDYYEVFDRNGQRVERMVNTLDWTPAMAEKGGYRHYMLKEIHEQPEALSNTIRPRITSTSPYIYFDEFKPEEYSDVRRMILVACGTSWHACLVGKWFFERFVGIPCSVELGSEFRYGRIPLTEDTLVVALSQSGETADTLESIREAKKRNAKVLAVTNVLGSTITREADHTIFTWAGPEIGVASTKTFTTQMAVLLMLALSFGARRGVVNEKELSEMVNLTLEVPGIVKFSLEKEKEVRDMAKNYFKFQNFLYLGRGLSYPIAMEGALKLKEISYIHAEAYAAGEMKHGPLALVDENMPSVFVVHKDETATKTIANMEEIKARGGEIITFSTYQSSEIQSLSDSTIFIPTKHYLLSPFALSVFLQLFAYYVAVLRGTDVDQPRNLAKSVTVE